MAVGARDARRSRCRLLEVEVALRRVRADDSRAGIYDALPHGQKAAAAAPFERPYCASSRRFRQPGARLPLSSFHAHYSAPPPKPGRLARHSRRRFGRQPATILPAHSIACCVLLGHRGPLLFSSRRRLPSFMPRRRHCAGGEPAATII